MPRMGEGTTEAPTTSGSKFLLTASSLSSLAGTSHLEPPSPCAEEPTSPASSAASGGLEELTEAALLSPQVAIAELEEVPEVVELHTSWKAGWQWVQHHQTFMHCLLVAV